MRDQSDREPSTSNVEGSPTLVYEVWDWVTSDKHWQPLDPEECHWRFIGYRVLSLRQMLKYREFGYLVVRSKAGDRRDSTPLFPVVGAAQEYPPYGMD